MAYYRDLTLYQIDNMDSIFSIFKPEEEMEPAPIATENRKKLGFLELPAELRNQIYFFVFAPVAPELCLFPSRSDFNSLGFLHTCRQIYHEARNFAYALSYTVTNRWHRADLVQMSHYSNSLPSWLSAPIINLDLQTQWRLPHKDTKTGKLEFFEGFADWAWWVWDCLELFQAVKRLKIVHSWRPDIDGLHCLGRGLAIDTDLSPPVYRAMHVDEPRKWRVVPRVEKVGDEEMIKRLFLVGKNERRGRVVEIECVAVSKEDLAQYNELDYGRIFGGPGKS